MPQLVLPKIECEASTQNYGRFAIGPMSQGYGLTVGLALRRVLISSLSGAAITAMRVSGVPHEFTVIPGAKEDMTMLLLNLKQVRLISHSDEQVRMRVSARGKSVVTAGDIEAPADIDIINPELQLLTLDTLDSELEIELTVEKGMGYSPSEDRKNLPIGEIPVDAIFSPVAKAGYEVESARIEQITNYDLLKLEIWTDGSIEPAEALSQAARILIDHIAPVSAFMSGEPETVEVESGTPTVASEYYDVPIEELELQMRAYNCLRRAGVTSVGDVLERMAKGVDELLAIRHFGEKSLNELLSRLEEKGYLPKGFDIA